MATIKSGTYVHVRNGSKQKWTKAIFLTTIQSLSKPHICVALGDEERWRKGGVSGKVSMTQWEEMEEIKVLPKVGINIPMIATIKGCELEQVVVWIGETEFCLKEGTFFYRNNINSIWRPFNKVNNL